MSSILLVRQMAYPNNIVYSLAEQCGIEMEEGWTPPSEIHEVLHTVLTVLSDEEKETLLMYYRDKKPIKHIAHCLNISEKKIRDRIADIECQIALPSYVQFLKYGLRKIDSTHEEGDKISRILPPEKHLFKSQDIQLQAVLSEMISSRKERYSDPIERVRRKMFFQDAITKESGSWKFVCQEHLWDDHYYLFANNVLAAEWNSEHSVDNVQFPAETPLPIASKIFKLMVADAVAEIAPLRKGLH